MRMALLACAIAAALTGAALAQDQPQINPQFRVQIPQTNRLPTPRQTELLRNAGITRPGPLRAATTLSVNAPVVGRSRLEFFMLQHYTPSSSGPGAARMRANPPTGETSWVEIIFHADPALRYIVDCDVAEGRATQYRFIHYIMEGTTRRRQEARVTRSSDGRVGTVLLAGAGGQVFLVGDSESWQLRFCEIIPVG